MGWRRGFLAGLLVCAGSVVVPAAASASTISQSFSSASIPLNDTATLTFTITGTDAVPPTVSFDDTLPAGLAVSPGSQSTNCVGTASGGTDVVFSGFAPMSGSTCTVSASVRGVQAGHWDDPTNETIGVGLANTSTDASLDVVAPPSISAAFGTSLLGLHGTTPLTFTITNPNPSFALTGIAFTNTLPAGLEIAAQPRAGDTCAGVLTAAAGTDSVGMSGGQLAPGSSCTMSATVVAAATGALSDMTSQVTSNEGGIGNAASAALTVIGPPTIALSSPASGRVYAFRQAVRARYSCADDPSGPGVASCTGNVPSGSLINTSKAGKHTFTVTAISGDGGVATDVVSYSVAPDNRFKLARPHVKRGGAIAFAVKVPGPGRITVLETIRGSRLVFGHHSAVARRAGTVRLTLKPTARGRRALGRRHAVRLTVIVSYTPKGGAKRTRRLHLRLR